MQINARLFRVTGCVFALALAGCLPAMPSADSVSQTANPDSGSTSTSGNSNPSPSSGSTSDMGINSPTDDLGPVANDMKTGAPSDMANVACDKLQSTNADGQHNPGKECLGCHSQGGGAPAFTLGGTIYSAATGGSAVTGATINITDAAGKTLKLVSAQNGNFWTSTPLVFPIRVNASLCPATKPMVGAVNGNGACNNCHNSTLQVHVP